MRKLSLALCATLALSLYSSLSLAQTKLRLSHSMSTNEPIHHAAEKFAKAVNARTGGKVQVTVFPSGQLGGNKEMYEQVRKGAPIIQVTDPAFLADYVADFGILMAPYVVDGPTQFNKLLASDWYKEVDQKLQQSGFHNLSFNYFFGTRHMLSNKPIRSVADLQGVTMRISPTVVSMETFKALGSRNVALQWPEVYSALSQNVIDAVEAPLGSLVGSKLQEQRKVISMTGHFTAYIGMTMNQKLFASLPADVQQILTEESIKAGDEMTAITVENDKKLIEDLKKQGITIVNDVNVNDFRKATLPVYSAFPAWTPNLHSRIQKILETQ
jgi:tripartite ATP-independent transporter DctP family solute receptor